MSEKAKKRTPTSEYRRWLREMDASQRRMRKWHKQGDQIQARFQDRRGIQGSGSYGDPDNMNNNRSFRVNLFNTNVVTLKSMLYGNTPKVDVSRRYDDADDDPARVASYMLGRLLNNDPNCMGVDTDTVFAHVLEDRLLPGLAVARVRYEFKSRDQEVPAIEDEEGNVTAAGYTSTEIAGEYAPIDYVHWDDFRWGWCRTWDECPWVAFRSYLTKGEVESRFGEEAAKQLNYKKVSTNDVVDKRLTADEVAEAGTRAEVWEIWEKKSKKVFWWNREFEKTLGQEEDPLELYNFFPCPKPWIANPVTNLFLPQPDFTIAQDLYNEIDQLETRIAIVTDAVRVVGVYDKANAGIQRMLQEGVENDLIPIDSWAVFAEKGGVEGAISWLPLQDIISALERLVIMRSDAMGLLYEVTGMAEIMRGNNGPDRETADASNNKKQFASVRVQAMQEEFARFCSSIMTLKAEVICKHFETSTIVKESNIAKTADAKEPALVAAALNLLKSPSETYWRIKIEPESIAMIDYQSQRAERTTFLEGLSGFIASAVQMVELDGRTMPLMVEFVKWGMAGFKGSNEIEGVIDRALETLKQPKPPEQGNNDEAIKLQAQREQNAHDEKMLGLKAQSEQQTISLKKQAAQEETIADLQKELTLLKAELQKDLTLVAAEADKDIQVEAIQSAAAITEDNNKTANTLKVEEKKAETSMKVEDKKADTTLKVEDKKAETAVKVAKAKPKPASKGAKK